MRIATLSRVYKNERDADVRERILLIRRVRIEKEAASAAEESISQMIDGGLAFKPGSMSRYASGRE